MVNQWLPSLQHFHYMVYWIAFFAAFLETALLVGLMIPGSTILLLLGAYAAGGNADFMGLWWFAITGAILGDNLNYFLGRHYGHRWVERGFWFVKPHHLQPARRFFDAHGGKSVFLGRFIPSVKELIPFVAGTVGMRQRTFMLLNILGAMGWGLEWLGAGYLFAQSLNIAQLWLPRVGLLLLLLFVVYLLFWGLQRLMIRYGQSVLGFTLSVWRSIRTAIIHNADVQALVKKHSRFFGFIKIRLDRSHFYGLTLTLLGLSFLYVLVLFGGIVEDLISADPIVFLDKNVAQMISVFRTPEILQLFTWITELGNIKFILPLLLLISAALFVVGRGLLIVPLLTSLIGSFGFTQLGKIAFQRPRPAEAVLLEQSYSFPSGHATLAVGFYGVLVYLLIRHSAKWKVQVRYFFAGALLILLIGLSRIIVGVHYLSDVWAGYLVGAMWLIISISMTEWLVSINRVGFKAKVTAQKQWTVVALLASAVIYYLVFAALYQPPMAPKTTLQTVELNKPLVNELQQTNLQYSNTILGKAEQPIGVAIITQDDNSLYAQLEQAGWQSARKISLQNTWQMLLNPNSLSNTSLSPVFWNNHINDIAFVYSASDKPSSLKNTLRLWRTSYRIQGARVYVGITRHQSGTFWRVFHTVNTDIDASKEDLLSTLQQAGVVKATCNMDFVRPMTGKYFISGSFFSKGKLTLLDLMPTPLNNPNLCPDVSTSTTKGAP